MNNEIRKYMTPSNDVIFKRLFGKIGNERLIKDFLEAVLKIEIESVELGKETQLLPEKIDQKLGILDVKVVLPDGTKIDVEMQNVNYGNITKRLTYYCSSLYVDGLSRGRDYKELNKTIAIGILNFDYFEDIEEYHTVWKMTEQKNKIIKEANQEYEYLTGDEELRRIAFLKRKYELD